MVVLVVFSPYLILGGPLALGILFLARRTFLIVVSLVLTVATIAIQVPHYVGVQASRSGPLEFRILSANLREGEAGARQLVDVARDKADVLTFQELTPLEVERLSAAGLDAIFPYRWLDARERADGVGIWSRIPLAATRRIDGYTFPILSAQLSADGQSPGPTVVAVHLVAPWPQPIHAWRQEIALLPDALGEIADPAGSGCVIVAGDFNSTTDMRSFRDLTHAGYQFAGQTRAGYLRTYPADSVVPPLIAIDHLLTRNCTAINVRTADIPGSDHCGLVATVTYSVPTGVGTSP
jgi:endonuclease/exonuclease/phosphatase (EEP) superfamily protein YafD